MNDEINVLRSIFCKPGEFNVLCNGTDQTQETVIVLDVPKPESVISSVGGSIQLTFTLSSKYPSELPSISVSGDVARREGSAAASNSDLGSTTDVEMKISQCHSEVMSTSDLCNMTGVSTTTLQCRTVLLRLDHMRNRVSYVKTLVSWAKELHLTGRLVFYERLINIVFQGTDKSVKDCLLRFRTVNVDVDSRGRSCKERMMSVLLDVPSVTQCFHDFAVVDVHSAAAFRDVFAQQPLGDLCSEHVERLLRTR